MYKHPTEQTKNHLHSKVICNALIAI